MAGWLRGNALVSVSEVIPRRARLVLEWVVCGRVNHLGNVTSHPCQLSLAIPLCGGAIATDLCDKKSTAIGRRDTRQFVAFIPLHQIAHVGVSPSRSLKLFGREIIFEVFQPV